MNGRTAKALRRAAESRTVGVREGYVRDRKKGSIQVGQGTTRYVYRSLKHMIRTKPDVATFLRAEDLKRKYAIGLQNGRRASDVVRAIVGAPS